MNELMIIMTETERRKKRIKRKRRSAMREDPIKKEDNDLPQKEVG